MQTFSTENNNNNNNLTKQIDIIKLSILWTKRNRIYYFFCFKNEFNVFFFCCSQKISTSSQNKNDGMKVHLNKIIL